VDVEREALRRSVTTNGSASTSFAGRDDVLNEPVLNPTTDAEEITALKAQIADNTARLAVLEAKSVKKIPQPPPIERGVTITELKPEVGCELPSPDQLRELANVVFREFPQLAPTHRHGARDWEAEDIERRWHKGFEASFTALASMRRLDAPDHRRYAHPFVDHAESWLRSYGLGTDCVGETFFPACLAFGDVPWVDPRIDGQVLALGLNAYTGRPASAEAWQRVLRTGELLPPTPKVSRYAPPSPARVINLGGRY